MNGGATWLRSSAPRLTGTLDAVSCPSRGFCLATGGFGTPEESFDNAYSSTNLGATWHEVGSRVGLYNVSSLSCANSSLCFGIWTGSLERTTDAGAVWTTIGLPTPIAGDIVTATSVSCPSVASCFVVGNAVDMSTSSADLVIWRLRTGTFHSVLATPSTDGTALVSCTAAGICAVASASAPIAYYASVNGGATWSDANMPASAARPEALSCVGHSCTTLAVPSGRAPVRAFSTVNGGASWSVESVSASATYNASLACAGAAACFADGFGPRGTIAVRQSGAARWSIRAAATGPSELVGVSCPTSTECMSVGGTFALRSLNNGVSWAAASTGIPAGVSLTSVACASASVCTATGTIGAAGAIYRTTNFGARWSAVSVPSGWQPSVAPPGYGYIARVGCTTGLCVITGGTASGILVSTNSGGSWSLKLFPSTWTGSGDPSLTDLSCLVSECIAVGNGDGSAGIVLKISGGGSSWSIATPAGLNYPVSIQCATKLTCWSEGTYQDMGTSGAIPGVYRTTTGGATWTLLSHPSLTGDPGLVACAASTCHQIGSGPLQTPFIDEFASSTDGGATWSRDVMPSQVIQIFDVTKVSGRWIGVGDNNFGGPQVVTSP